MGDSVRSSYAHCKIVRDGTDDMPIFTTELVNKPSPVKDRHEALLRLIVYLVMGIVIFLLAFSALTTFFIVAKLTKDTEMVTIIRHNQQSIRELYSTFNSTIETLRNETIEKSRHEMEAEYSNIERKLSRSISEMDSLINRTRSLMNTTFAEAVQASLNSLNHSTPRGTEIEICHGDVFTFNIDPLLRKFSKQNEDIYTEPQKQIVDRIPIAVKINLHDYDHPHFHVYVGCYEDANIPFIWPLHKSIQLVVLTDRNGEFWKTKIPPSKIPDCRTNDYSEYWIDRVAKFRNGSALVNHTIRIQVRAVD